MDILIMTSLISLKKSYDNIEQENSRLDSCLVRTKLSIVVFVLFCLGVLEPNQTLAAGSWAVRSQLTNFIKLETLSDRNTVL